MSRLLRSGRCPAKKRTATAVMLALGAAVFLSACPKTVHHAPLLTPEETSPAVLIAGGNVFDSRRGIFVGPRNVYTLGPRITAVTTVDARPPGGFPEAHKRIDAAGQYVMPGLVDAHTHIAGDGSAPWIELHVPPEENLEAYLRAGITTVFDLGGDPAPLKVLKTQIARRDIVGPRIFSAGMPITAPGAHPIPLIQDLYGPPLSFLVPFLVPQVEDEDDAEKVVREIVADGADYIKVHYDRLPESKPRMDKERLSMVVKAAHRAGKKVVVHIGSAQNAIDAAEVGADLLAHGIYRGAVSPAQAKVIASYRIPVIFTLAAWTATNTLSERTYQPGPLEKAWVAKEQYEPLTQPAPPLSPLFDEFLDQVHRDSPHWVKNAKTLYDAGVPMWVGTDSSLPGIYPGASYHRELQLLAAAGIDTGDLLRAATLWPAQWLGHAPLFGVLERGAFADILVVPGDPLQDLAVLTTASHIIAAGRVHTPR